MTDASRDGNFVTGKLACLNTDTIQGQHLIPIQINSSNNSIKVNTTDVISFSMRAIDPRDDNYVGCWLFVGADGLTYPAVANTNGELLIEM